MDKIDKRLSGLSNDELRDLVKRAKKLLAKKPGRPSGRSKDPYHTACRVAADRVLRWKRDWLDHHPQRRTVSEKETIKAIERECQNDAFAGRDLETVKEAIHERVKRKIRWYLPARILKDLPDS